MLDGMGPQLMPCRILWPMLRDTSASNINLAIFSGHWIFRGYRTDTDLTVALSVMHHRKAFLKWDFALRKTILEMPGVP